MKRNLMQSIMIALLITATVFAFTPVVSAADRSPLVSTGWLADNLNEPGMVIIDVRTKANYGFAHLPGAVNMPYSGWQPYNTKLGCQLMPTPEEMTAKLRALGVNQSSHVVIYDAGNTALDATEGGAAVWILEAMGHENVSYLDGGFTKWTFEGRVIDKKKPATKEGDFAAKLDPGKVANLKDVTDNLKTKEAIFLDVRSSIQHFGIDKRSDVARYGHIPDSLNFPADFMTNAGINRAPATIKTKVELEAMAEGIGLPKDKDTKIIVYCNSAQQAGMGYFILRDIMGYRNVQAYDGSMLEYAQDEKLPLVKFAWGFVTE